MALPKSDESRPQAGFRRDCLRAREPQRLFLADFFAVFLAAFLAVFFAAFFAAFFFFLAIVWLPFELRFHVGVRGFPRNKAASHCHVEIIDGRRNGT